MCVSWAPRSRRPPPLNVSCFVFVCFFFPPLLLRAGLDASAQTTSHELTIPNDVSIPSAGGAWGEGGGGRSLGSLGEGLGVSRICPAAFSNSTGCGVVRF